MRLLVASPLLLGSPRPPQTGSKPSPGRMLSALGPPRKPQKIRVFRGLGHWDPKIRYIGHPEPQWPPKSHQLSQNITKYRQILQKASPK